MRVEVHGHTLVYSTQGSFSAQEDRRYCVVMELINKRLDCTFNDRRSICSAGWPIAPLNIILAPFQSPDLLPTFGHRRTDNRVTLLNSARGVGGKIARNVIMGHEASVNSERDYLREHCCVLRVAGANIPRSDGDDYIDDCDCD